MATVEVDEEQLRQLTGLQRTVQAIWANPKARKLVQQAQKTVDPNAKTPDLDAEAQILGPVEEIRKEFKDFIAKTQAEKDEDRKNAELSRIRQVQDLGFAKLKGEMKYTDDGLAAVKKLMEDKAILDPLDAAAIFERDHPPQTPVTPGGTGAWNFTELPTEGADHLKKMIDTKGTNDLIAEKMAWEAINEVRGVSRR